MKGASEIRAPRNVGPAPRFVERIFLLNDTLLAIIRQTVDDGILRAYGYDIS